VLEAVVLPTSFVSSSDAPEVVVPIPTDYRFNWPAIARLIDADRPAVNHQPARDAAAAAL